MSEQDHSLVPLVFQDHDLTRTMIRDAEGYAWWVASEICDFLGIRNPRMVARALQPNQKGVISNDTLGGEQNVLIINFSGVLDILSRSRKPVAKALAHAFHQWILHEALPRLSSSVDARIADLESQLAASQARAERYHALVPLAVSHGPSRSAWKRHLPAITTFLKARTEFIWHELLDALDLPRYPNDHECRLSLALLDVGWHPQEKPPWEPGMLWDKQELFQRWAYTGVCFGRAPKPPITPTALAIHRGGNGHA